MSQVQLFCQLWPAFYILQQSQEDPIGLLRENVCDQGNPFIFVGFFNLFPDNQDKYKISDLVKNWSNPKSLIRIICSSPYIWLFDQPNAFTFDVFETYKRWQSGQKGYIAIKMLSPLGCLPLSQGYIDVKIMKILYLIQDASEHSEMIRGTNAFCNHQNFAPTGYLPLVWS